MEPCHWSEGRHNNVGVSLRERRATMQEMLWVSLRARWDATLEYIMMLTLTATLPCVGCSRTQMKFIARTMTVHFALEDAGRIVATLAVVCDIYSNIGNQQQDVFYYENNIFCPEFVQEKMKHIKFENIRWLLTTNFETISTMKFPREHSGMQIIWHS